LISKIPEKVYSFFKRSVFLTQKLIKCNWFLSKNTVDCGVLESNY